MGIKSLTDKKENKENESVEKVLKGKEELRAKENDLKSRGMCH